MLGGVLLMERGSSMMLTPHSFSALSRIWMMPDGLSFSSTTTRHRLSSAELTRNEGFSVVAPMRTIVPFSTWRRKASCIMKVRGEMRIKFNTLVKSGIFFLLLLGLWGEIVNIYYTDNLHDGAQQYTGCPKKSRMLDFRYFDIWKYSIFWFHQIKHCLLKRMIPRSFDLVR